MNNQQFRRLVFDTPARPQNGEKSPSKPVAATPFTAFGSRSKSSFPMTPRNVKSSVEHDFARQLAQRDAAPTSTQKLKSSSAPKGTKLAAGYQDRTKERQDEEGDDRARRIKALEEQMKLEQIDLATFERLRDEITGGDVGATHLVKGLDRKLLERVRRGENVMEEDPNRASDGNDAATFNDEEEFEALERKAVAPLERETVTKKGQLAPQVPVAGGKRKRDAIIAELKASRAAARASAAAAQPQLGDRFRKIGHEPRIEVDERGREVMIVVGEDGKVKRKVRKVKTQGTEDKDGLLEVDRDAKPLGIEDSELPQIAAPEPEDEDDDIFQGVGADYDPLAALGDEDDSEVSEEDGDERGAEPKSSEEAEQAGEKEARPKSRNYFNDNGPTESVFDKPDDAALVQTLQKASRIAATADKSGEGESATDEGERLKRRAAMLAARDRDLDDVDMGFGSSRFGDAEEAEGDDRTKLSEWKGVGGEGDDDDGGQRDRGGKKRKRGPKKKKGDKDNAADVLKVMERRHAG